MRSAAVEARHGRRWGILAIAAVVAVTAVFVDPADARPRRKKGGGYTPPYAAFVIDVNSGKVLHAANADSLRHPASLAKIMTLYLLFEQIEAGKLKLDTPLDVSVHASRQAPSKLGLKPGQTIEVEDAIQALVTKSANDAAVVVAEAVAGDETEFAALMTRKARALGMSKTVYRNASGLPDDEQVTTARDQALLGRAIQDRFPRHYRYFSTHAFNYRGMRLRNHNKLLGRVAGVDGIKTGYIRASGFNLVASVRRGNRHVVAVVLGGPSGGWRDTRMRGLIEENIVVASTTRTTTRIVEAGEPRPAPAKMQLAAAGEPIPARADPAPTPSIAAAPPSAGSAEPIQPIPVKTISVGRGPLRPASMASMPAPHAAEARPADAQLPPFPDPSPMRGTVDPSSPALALAATDEGMTANEAVSAIKRAIPSRGEWVIQVGAFAEEDQAKAQLNAALSVAKEFLRDAGPLTERIVVKGDKALYRARFAGFDKDQAQAACRVLKRHEITCLAIKN